MGIDEVKEYMEESILIPRGRYLHLCEIEKYFDHHKTESDNMRIVNTKELRMIGIEVLDLLEQKNLNRIDSVVLLRTVTDFILSQDYDGLWNNKRF